MILFIKQLKISFSRFKMSKSNGSDFVTPLKLGSRAMKRTMATSTPSAGKG